MRFQPARLYIERDVENHPTTLAIRRRLGHLPVHLIESHQDQGFSGLPYNRRFKAEKSGLILAYKKGDLVKEVQRDLFRETPNEYYIIHSMGCPFDCQYCFLYDYLQHQIPTVFVNLDEIVDAVRATLESRPGERLIFHAGEFSDALAFDHITDLSRPLVELFAAYDHATLELRTKSDNVNNLLGLNHKGRTVVSWTFSPQRVVQRMEYHTASAQARIEAARACQQAGYPVALRLDPMVRYPGWEDDYRKLVAHLGARLDPTGIVDCQLGVFRYTPGLGKIIRERFPKSWLRLEESVPSRDGKYRYFKLLRLEMYRKIIGWLRRAFPGLRIELCMESPEVEDSLQACLHGD